MLAVSGIRHDSLTFDPTQKATPILKFFHLLRVYEIQEHQVLELVSSHFTIAEQRHTIAEQRRIELEYFLLGKL